MRRIAYVFVFCLVAMCARGDVVKSNIGVRSIMTMGDKKKYPLPEGLVAIAYLKSTGTQWIDTGVIANIKRIVTIDFDYEYDSLNQTQVIIAGRVITGTKYWYKLTVRSIYNGRLLEPSILLTNVNNAYTAFNRNKVIMNYDCLMDVNGIKYGNSVHEQRTTTDTFHLLYHPESSSSWHGFVGRLYGCSIATLEGELLIDLIPVRKDSIGYFYDRVSGQLFGNMGTGNFIIGPDV